MSLLGEAADLMQQLLDDAVEAEAEAYRAGVRAGRFAAELQSQELAEAAYQRGRIAGRSEAFRLGYAYAISGGRLWRGEVA